MISRRARAHAGRVIAGSGAQEPLGPRGNGPRHLPNFGNGLHLGNQGGGYTGLQGVLAALQGGVSGDQYSRMLEGHTGGNGWGGIGGMGGAFKGLSPYAVHFLTQNLLEKKAPELASTEGLTGDDLWKATLMNNLATQNADANPSYQLHSGVDQDMLQQLFAGGFQGHSAYEKGYNANGPRGGNSGAGQFNPIRRRPFRPGPIMRRPMR